MLAVCNGTMLSGMAEIGEVGATWYEQTKKACLYIRTSLLLMWQWGKQFESECGV
jgi:hypothetical protein